ncbi:MAG: response regulator [Paenibacillaceae bacterium]|jgi:two-component system response regulator YesN|nr:response regulator [Paenibacillaceae bacterium]
MYNVIIVDDEWYAVQAVKKRINWFELNVTGIFEAYDADEAMEQCKAYHIDIMICDIEMPGSNGLELCKWMNEYYPLTPCILVTGHASFEYAQQAIHLNVFEYILKSVDYDQLQQVFARAIAHMEQEREAQAFNQLYNKYYKLWENQKPILVERFWQDIFHNGIGQYRQPINAMLTAYHMPGGLLAKQIWPVMLSIEQWHKEFDSRDEEIMSYALRNAAEELLIRHLEGAVIQERPGILFALLYLDEDDIPSAELLASRLKEDCQMFIHACNRYFYCDVSCYVGDMKPLPQVTNVYHALLELEHNNVTRMNSVIALSEMCGQWQHSENGTYVSSIMWHNWMEMIDMGKKGVLLAQINDTFARLQEKPVHIEIVKAIYHSFLHLIYHLSHKRGISAQKLIGSEKLLEDPASVKSLSKLQHWAIRLVNQAIDGINNLDDDHSAIIGKVKHYIEEHLHEVTREQVADHVYLNPAYLSRLFKKETGLSLTEYIIAARINRTKTLLTTSNIKIGDIGASVGYDNFSYFTKIFKKMAGVTPQEYRKKYQI